MRYDHEDKQTVLFKAFDKLFRLYPEENFSFYVSITCNVVLKGGPPDAPTFSIFWGQDHHKEDKNRFDLDNFKVSKLQDVSKIRTQFVPSEFESVFYNALPNSQVTVHEIVSLVYIIRKIGSKPFDRKKASTSKGRKGVFTTVQL